MAGGLSGVHQKTLVWECSAWGPSKTMPESPEISEIKIRWACCDQSFTLAERRGRTEVRCWVLQPEGLGVTLTVPLTDWTLSSK